MVNVSGLVIIGLGLVVVILGARGNQKQLLPQIFGNFTPTPGVTENPGKQTSMVSVTNL